MNNLLNNFRNLINTKREIVLIVLVLIFIITGIIFNHCLTKKEIVITPTEKAKPKEESPENILPEVVWTKYVSSDLGFSIDIPDKAYCSYMCFDSEITQVPITIFEDIENKVAYVSEKYYYKTKRDDQSDKYIESCEKIIYSLKLLKEKNEYRKEFLIDGVFRPMLRGAIIMKTVKNDDELDEFIKENYGPGCHVGDKKFWKKHLYQEGVYDVSVRGEINDKNTTLRTTSCEVAWTTIYKVLYFPKKNKIMSVILGGDCCYGTNPHSQPYQCYDEKMVNSFRFE